jgi:hypothetical protein
MCKGLREKGFENRVDFLIKMMYFLFVSDLVKMILFSTDINNE